jgi:diacylglycerol kinase (ATP)
MPNVPNSAALVAGRPADAGQDGPPFLIVAPRASRLADPARREALVAAAIAEIRARWEVDPEVRTTATAAAGRAAVADAVAARSRLVAVAGGDGSVRTAAAVLAGTGIPLGIVPAGTGNLLAAALGIPRDPRRAVALLGAARVRPIDLGRAALPGDASGATTPFVVAAGVGFDARVMAATTDRRKRSLGVAAYFAAAASVAVRVRPFGVRLVVDGTVHESDALAVLVANAGELVPGLLRPRLALVPDDGLLDILVARGRGVFGGSRAAVELMLGRGVHTAIGPYAARFIGRRVEVTTDTPEPVEVDGDVVGWGALTADVQPGALLVLAP